MATTPEANASVVLVVTEDRELREAAERALPAEGFEVVTASHAGHALLACLAGRRVDVLVTELAMQDMAGPRLAESVRRYFPGLPVVYLAHEGTHKCAGVLVRPFTHGDLVRQIGVALCGARGCPIA